MNAGPGLGTRPGPGTRPVQLPEVAAPLVSVLMLTYGARDWVEEAVGALVANTAPVYELIVVDNASPDGTADWFAERFPGATLVRNARNVGFGPGNNQAALLASGRYLCFLNSDAMVEPGWLDPMVGDLELVRGCGAVVPRLLNIDGTLQEAGSVIGAKGETMAIGFGDDPDRPWYRFPRFVDYGSAACMMMERSVFQDHGGFDPAYGAAYYEDADLCMRLRRAGQKVVYEPRAKVRHVRGASSSSAAVLRLRDRNAEVFARRWSGTLGARPVLEDLPGHPYRVAAARDADVADRFLLLASRLPRSSEDRMAALALAIAGAAGDARVTMVGLEEESPVEEAAWLLAAGIELVWGVTDWADWLWRCMCHYSVVVLGDPRAGSRMQALLPLYQPGAALVLDTSVFPPDAYPPSVRDKAVAMWGPDVAGPAMGPALAELGAFLAPPPGWWR